MQNNIIENANVFIYLPLSRSEKAPAQLMRIIGNMKNPSTTGLNYTQTRAVNLATDLLAPALTHLPISTDTFLAIRKLTKVIPLGCDPLFP